MTPFRWGILSTGRIARIFAEGLSALPDAELAAVGSRDLASAQRFAADFRGARAHGSYAALAADPEIDAIYVGTPHPYHRENTLLCLEHGKPVLCEKPFAMSAAEGREMVAAAREAGVFLMEAMWTRCNPVHREVTRLVREGAIGEPRMLQVDFGFRTDFDPTSRLFAPELGGGALLDVGVYCVSLAHHVFGGPPEALTGLAHLGETGVDEQSAWVMRFPGGRLAVCSSAVRTNTPQEAVLTGTEGRIRIPDFWHADRYVLGKREKRFQHRGNGYHYEAEEVARCVRGGLLESELLPLDETVQVLETMDRLRSEWGLEYPTGR